MKLGKVEKISFRYTLLKLYGKFIHDYFFYKKVTYIGLENIPNDKPVLIAPNHQNALMDALAIIYAQKGKQPVFLARSDIFKNSFIASMLFFLKILPVFRIRDGKEKLTFNDIVFEKAIKVLENNMQVVIFPEAQHFDKRHVRELKKGIQRIAFMLEEKHHFKAGVQIVPVGIYYSNYWNFRSKLLVKFGKPIGLENYFEDYKTDPARTIVKFTDELHMKIKEQVIHIEDLEYHDEYDLLTDICDKPLAGQQNLPLTRSNKLIIDKKIVEKTDALKLNDPPTFELLMLKLKDYSQKIKDLKIKDHIVENSNKKSNIFLRSLYLLIMLPIFMYGLINNSIVYMLPGVITKKLKDRQFESSIKYGFSIFLFPIVYLIQSLIVLIIFKSWLLALAYFLSLPFFGLAAFNMHRIYVKTIARFRFKFRIKKETVHEMNHLRTEIIGLLK